MMNKINRSILIVITLIGASCLAETPITDDNHAPTYKSNTSDQTEIPQQIVAAAEYDSTPKETITAPETLHRPEEINVSASEHTQKPTTPPETNTQPDDLATIANDEAIQNQAEADTQVNILPPTIQRGGTADEEETSSIVATDTEENLSGIEQAKSTPAADTLPEKHPTANARHTAAVPKLSTSPWEQFLINTISVIRVIQINIQHYCSVLFSKQGISLLIIIFGILLLNIVIWFAYASFKKEQADKIKNLMNNQNSIKDKDQHKPLSIAYAEESSGDYDVFATSEGIPIKLDLAQAYINMGDNKSAQTVLEDIIQQHRGKVVNMAQALLKKIT